jgi:tRNA(adenine34) deaminase
MDFSPEDQIKFMRLAMEQVEASIGVHGNPFGAVLINAAGEVLASARNTVTPETDITGHAELNLLRIANQKTGRQKFPDCAIFVNAASCSMCASAMIQAGIRNIYYGAPFEPHTNPAVSYEQLAPFCHEPLSIHGSILAQECAEQIKRGR